MKKVNTVIFDLDRTLLNLAIAEKNALEQIYNSELSCDHSFDDFMIYYKEINEFWWDQRSAGKASPEEVRKNRFHDIFYKLSIESHRTVDEISLIYMDLAKNYWVTYPNAVDILEILKDQSFKLAIITNGFTDVQKRKIEKLDIGRYFEVVIMSDDVSVAKPDKKIFDICLEKLGSSASESLYIGDDYRTDILGASNAGLHVMWFNEHSLANKDNFPEFKNYSSFFSTFNQIAY